MKRIFPLVTFAVLFIALCIAFTSCEGPAGPPGKDGKDGVNGTNGKDGNVTCGVCHNKGTVLFAKMVQYENSKHFTGGTYERNANNCAVCHTSEGFVERIQTGAKVTVAPTVDNASPINCRTCHNIHTNYDSTDWNLRTTSPVQLWFRSNITLDYKEGNICINCHQPRIPAPMPVVGGGNDTIKSGYWGVHHGTQSVILAGKGGYELPGAETYGSSHHTIITDGCITCHMGPTFGNQAGGHTWNVSYDAEGTFTINTNACTSCHKDSYKITTADVLASQAAIDVLIDSLKNKLITANILDAVSLLPKASSDSPLVLSSDQAGALMNYQLITEDRSHGIHNLKYVTALLKNSIAIFP